MRTDFLIALFFIASTTGVSGTAMADSDKESIHALQQALQALQKRVEALEAVKPTMASMMPNLAERFHVMHRAGEAGDWAVAGHELLEMKRLTDIATYIDETNGQLMQGMLEQNFTALEAAIDHGNNQKFQTALGQTVETCNACHKAAGSPFVQVTLNAEDSISIRHPHALAKSAMQGGHMH